MAEDKEPELLHLVVLKTYFMNNFKTHLSGFSSFSKIFTTLFLNFLSRNPPLLFFDPHSVKVETYLVAGFNVPSHFS